MRTSRQLIARLGAATLSFLLAAMPAAAESLSADDRRAYCERMFAHVVASPIRFYESTADFRPPALAVLDRLVEFAHDCSPIRIRITGHSDASGPETFNLDLSRRRAAAVAAWLKDRGVAAERLIVDGVGSAEPIADNATRIGRQKNRRIEFELLP